MSRYKGAVQTVKRSVRLCVNMYVYVYSKFCTTIQKDESSIFA